MRMMFMHYFHRKFSMVNDISYALQCFAALELGKVKFRGRSIG